MRALSIRQPYAELILRGEKSIEYRSRPTRLVGERFYIYASKAGTKARPRNRHEGTKGCGFDPFAVSPCHLATLSSDLPRGVIVGTAIISKCVRVRSQVAEVSQDGSSRDALTDSRPLTPDACALPPCLYEWHLTGVKRFKRPRQLLPGVHPQPVWFWPFGRKNVDKRGARRAA